MAIDFKKFAENVARRGEVEALLPIVEKELILSTSSVRSMNRDGSTASRSKEEHACVCVMALSAIARILISPRPWTWRNRISPVFGNC